LEPLILLDFKKLSSESHREKLGTFSEAQIWRSFQACGTPLFIEGAEYAQDFEETGTSCQECLPPLH
jgi:hypothetical protein